jgi:hypothetical protein
MLVLTIPAPSHAWIEELPWWIIKLLEGDPDTPDLVVPGGLISTQQWDGTVPDAQADGGLEKDLGKPLDLP